MTTQILSIVLLSFFFIVTLSEGEKCNPNDKKALLKIQKDLNYPYILTSWHPDTDCCGWYCVDCDPTTNRITALTIFGGDLPGEIPASVGNLPFLETLIFRKLTNLTGTIPNAISKLKNLKMVRLSWTGLSGSVPSFFSDLPNLNFLDLAFNNLSGSIPESLSKLKNLEAIHLDRNKLTGSIPESFGKFTGKVPDLYLSHNKLSGTIPNSIKNLNFSTIDLSRNNLQGDASILLGSNKTLFKLDISRNAFEYDFTKTEFPESLAYLDVSHNKIFGSLPESLGRVDLQFLNVSYNRLCGKIPVGEKLQSFDDTVYFHNRCLCGAPLANCK